MTGPEPVKQPVTVPAQGQAPQDGGGKLVSDFISSDTKIDTSGNVIGTIHYVTGVKSFPGEEDGYFLPVTIDAGGKEITCTSKTKTTKSFDTDWLLRITDSTSTFEFKAEGMKTILLKFTSTKLEPPVGEIAFNKDKKDYGAFGNNTLYYENGAVDIAWEGTTATVTGKLLYVKKDDSTNKLNGDGHYFAFSLIKYFDGKDINVTCKNDKSGQFTDWVMTIDDVRTITVKCENTLIATYDLSAVELAPNA